jgi:hypothetical protein
VGPAQHPLSDGVIAPNFTDGVPGSRNGREPRALEDRQIDHDAGTMIGWLTASAPHVSWCRFTGFGKRLYVANANRDIPENTLGTDLIYFNATRQSLVLVQYKRMDPRNGNYYYPDSDDGLAVELERMEKVDTLEAASASAYRDLRLDPAPSWLKVCQSQAFIPQTADMVMGMYFTREHFERLRKDQRCQGPQGGTRFGFKNLETALDQELTEHLGHEKNGQVVNETTLTWVSTGDHSPTPSARCPRSPMPPSLGTALIPPRSPACAAGSRSGARTCSWPGPARQHPHLVCLCGSR